MEYPLEWSIGLIPSTDLHQLQVIENGYRKGDGKKLPKKLTIGPKILNISNITVVSA